MNKTYRLIWSLVKNTWVITAETVKGKGGPPPLTRSLLAAASVLALSSGALALPTGSQVVNGTVTMNTAGKTLTVTNTPNSIINWQSFSIAAGETTRFVQQSATSAVLNRVVGVDPSSIMGTLQSNGRIFLINPNGIIFGQGSRVDAAGLVASSLNMSDADFMGGRYIFNAGATAGAVKNQGEITTPSGGHVWLIAPNVENSGIITSPSGTITLAAGQSVHVVDPDKPEVAVVVSAPTDQAVNIGSLVAHGGRIAMYGAIVGHKGTINANSATRGENGKIYFKSTKGTTIETGSVTTANGPDGGTIIAQTETGDTMISGTISATGTDGTGGIVQLLGQRVGLIDNANIDASGTTGGGTVLVGGDYQGKNPDIQNATATYVGKDTIITADSLFKGDGGKVIVWADDATQYYGSISARGGSVAGNGGFVETSGKQTLDFTGKVDATAPNGQLGRLLLDPANITVQTLIGSPYTDVSTFAAQPGASLFVAPSVLDLVGASVTLQATNNITITDAINLYTTGAGFTAQAGGSIAVNANIATYGGAISLKANDPLGPATGTGTITTIGALDTTSGGNLAGANVSLSGKSITTGAAINAGTAGNVILNSSGAITQSAGTISAANLSATAATGITLTGGNDVASVSLNNTTTNFDISYSSNRAGGLTISAVNQGGSVFITETTGNINLKLTKTSVSGTANITATSGAIIDGDGAAVNVFANTLSMTANSGIGTAADQIETQVASLSATSTSGDIAITNTATTPGALTVITSLTGSTGGGIIFDNYGPLTTTGLIKAGVDITINAHSPLTIGSGGVLSTSTGPPGNIRLIAGSSGTAGAGDNLTINGPVSASGTIYLTAGDSILGTNIPTGANVVSLSNQNPVASTTPTSTATTASTLLTESTVVQGINISVIPTEESDPANAPQTESDEEKAKKEAKAKKDAEDKQNKKGEDGQQNCN